jgi:hypothetical protein
MGYDKIANRTDKTERKMMQRIYLPPNAILKNFLFLFAAFILQINIACANEDAAIKATFLNYKHIQFGDTRKAPWRIVQAKTWKEALANRESIAEGMSDAASVATISLKQREALYKVWQKAPQELWVIYFSQPDHLELQSVESNHYIALIPSLSDADQAQRDTDEKAAIATQKPLNPATYTQTGFDAKPFVQDFTQWQKHFKQDIVIFETNIKKDHDFGRKLIEDNKTEALKQSYAQSIDIGHKGLSLRQELISAYYTPAGHEGTEVSPSGYVMTQLLLSNKAKPVGYGGTFIDEGNTVELWYMVFDDMPKLTMQDFNESFNFKAFSPATLPPYKTIKRNNWPALVFARSSNGQIKLYGMSMELARILGTIYNAQLF